MSRRCPKATSTVAALMIAAAGLAGEARAGTDYDAAFVRMDAPDRVTVHEVFTVKIAMRNTGTKPWGGWPIRLRSVNPRNNKTWGTDYILIAQGTRVAPGQEYTFTSRLRAPAKPGRAGFQWQLCKEGAEWFGQPGGAGTIEVTARPAETPARTPEPKAASDGKRPLTRADFEYVGSFKAPKAVGQARGAFSESGLALRRTSDGAGRLFMNYTHPTQVLFEIDIPEPVRIERGRHADLRTAEVRKVWGPVKIARSGEQTIRPNGGFVWVERTRTLIWTWYHGYKTGSAPPVLGATRLSDDGKMTSRGPWYVSAPSGLYKSYWGGVMALPKAFADKYTGGRALALGFGGYYSICAPASRGPALGAIAEPDPAKETVAVTEMLVHPHNRPAPRDGNYFNANCGFWGDQPQSPAKGSWTYDDWCRAGAFIDAPSGWAYVAFVRLGTGRMGYDFGSIISAGQSQYWYFYDPNDLGQAAKGDKLARQVLPSSATPVRYPLGRSVTGACYDASSRRLYLCVAWAYPDGLESHPVIHMYRVK
ncbi:MAG: NBR1-Ig-like domain-containing protein [Phycisphaerae bacterium]